MKVKIRTDILISFIIPVFNAEKTLVRCLESIVHQSNKNFEIILVNDGSKDESQSIIDQYVKDYPNFIKSYIKPNGGPGESRNLGIKNATGIYVAFVDSDDYLEQNYTELISQSIEKYDPDLLIISYNRIYNKNPTIFERIYKFSDWDYFNLPFKIITKPEIIAKSEVAPWLRLIKRNIFLNKELLFGSFGCAEDLDASLKWYLNVDKVLFIDKQIYNYVINNQTLNTKTENLSQFNDVIKSVCGYYTKEDKFLTYFNELEFIFTKHTLLSTLIRLHSTKSRDNFQVFLSIRSNLIQYFSHFHKNKYLIDEPVYVRIAITMAYHFPRFYALFI